jgi:hypothetical protein
MTELSKAMEYLHKSVGEERRLRQEDIAEAHKMVKDADRRAEEAKEQAAEANRLAEESYKWAQTEQQRARRELDRVREAEKRLLQATQNVADVSDDLRECKGLLERLMQPGEGPRLLPGVDEMLEMTPGKIDMTAAASSSSSSSRGGPAEPLAVRQEPPFASTSFNLLTETHGAANMMNMEDTSQRRDKGRDRWLPTKVDTNIRGEDERKEMQAPALGGSNWPQTYANQAVDWRAATQDSGHGRRQASGGGGLKRRATPEKAAASSAARKKMSDVHIWNISSDDEP